MTQDIGSPEFNAAATEPSGVHPLPIDPKLVEAAEAFASDLPTVEVCYGCLRPIKLCACRPEAPAREHALWIGVPK